MAANTATLLPDFPISIGNRRLSIITLTGPSSYTQAATGTPPTGGQTLLASQFGLKYIDAVFSSMTDDGTYSAFFTPTTKSPQGITAGILVWNNAGIQNDYGQPSGSTNLSTFTLRVTAIGR